VVELDKGSHTAKIVGFAYKAKRICGADASASVSYIDLAGHEARGIPSVCKCEFGFTRTRVCVCAWACMVV